MSLTDGVTVLVTIEDRSERRTLAVRRPGEDEAALTLWMTGPEALMVASLLSEVRYVLDVEPSDVPVDGVHVETVTLGAVSPAVSVAVDQIEVPDPEGARILAVIRDDTPELTESDPRQLCHPGDRLVIAGRARPLRELRSYLVG